MSRTIHSWLILAASVVVLAIWPSTPQAGPLDPYIEGAKKEGEVKVGVTLRAKNQGKPAGIKYIQAFNQRYPFVKAELKRIGGARERERVLGEMTAGLVNFDVATISDTMVDPLVDAGVPMIVDWQKLGVPSYLAHPKNIGVSLRTSIYGIAYNRKLIPDKVAQDFTWETCADPKWKGKTAMDDRPRHLNIMYLKEAWGKEKTLDYAKRWAANKPSVEASRSTGAQKLAAGSYHMICGMPRRQVMDLRVYANDPSIGIVYPEPIPVSVGDLIYVPKKAKHPNAAVLFLAWTGTEEAQKILDDVDFSGHPAFPGSDINDVTKGKKTVQADWDDVKHADDHLAEILQAMGFPVVR